MPAGSMLSGEDRFQLSVMVGKGLPTYEVAINGSCRAAFLCRRFDVVGRESFPAVGNGRQGIADLRCCD